MANEEAALRIMGEMAVMCVSDFQSPIYTPRSQVGDCSDGTLCGKISSFGRMLVCLHRHEGMEDTPKGKHFIAKISHCVE